MYHSRLREIEDNAYAKFSGATKVYYGRFANGECNCKLSYINFNFSFLSYLMLIVFNPGIKENFPTPLL